MFTDRPEPGWPEPGWPETGWPATRWRATELSIVAWGVGGVLLLLGQAIWRLTPIALDAIHGGLTAGQIALCGAWIVVNGYAEGYRAFQLRFSPRVVARAVHLARHPRPLHVALAPLFCMSFFHATPRGRAVAWGVTLGVVGAVVLIRYLPQPWRGILDAGVVVALAWGALTLVAQTLRALQGHAPRVDAQLPEAIATVRDAAAAAR